LIGVTDVAKFWEVPVSTRYQVSHHLGMDALQPPSRDIRFSTRPFDESGQVFLRLIHPRRFNTIDGDVLAKVHDDIEVRDVFLAITAFVALVALLLAVERRRLMEFEARCSRGVVKRPPNARICIVEDNSRPAARL
jgi:hypothetical protein